MQLSDIKTIGIIGAGAMGAQLAQLFSQIGKYPVIISDINNNLVNNSIKEIEGRLKKYFVGKGKMTQDEMNIIMGRIKGTTSIAEVAKNSDYIVDGGLGKKGIYAFWDEVLSKWEE